MSSYWQALRAFSPSLRRFLISFPINVIVPFGIIAVLMNLYLLRLGFDVRFIGLMVAVGQLVWAAAAIPAGMFSIRIGLRNGIMLGQALSALGLALILLVETQPEQLWQLWLIGGQAVFMLGTAFITVNIPPYLMAVTGEQERRYAFALVQSLIPATAFLGSLAAGLLPGPIAGWASLTLDDAGPYRIALWTGPLLLFLAMLPLLGADPARAPQSDQRAAAEPAPVGLLAIFGAIVFLQSISEGAVRIFFNVYLDIGLDVPPAQIGTVMGVAQLLPIVAALSSPIFIARWGAGHTQVAAGLGIGACLFPLAAVPQLGVAALSVMGVMAMIALLSTARDLFGQEIVAPSWRTAIQGTLLIGLASGWGTAGIVGGYLIETLGFGALFAVGAISAVLAAGLLATFLHRRRVVPPPAPTSPIG
ncbi:MAG TPA: MFS transporter [Roseiflexaceae bacterium]|nr:MFS transporter [Roseiflexaceae bacterium]